MGQVPEKATFYGIVGNGRVSRHMQAYFKALQVPFQLWSRKAANIDPVALFSGCHTLLVLLKDSAIQDFILSHPKLQQKQLVHFSGCLSIPEAQSAHPLMSFGPELYELETYQKIPFICEAGKAPFKELFPHLPNPHYIISAEQKPLYHSLCVLAGNGSALLWSKLLADFEEKLGLPHQTAFLYLQKVCENLQHNYQSALTGPMVRNDQETIQKNLAALEGDAYQKVYQALVQAYEAKHEYS